MANKCFSMKSKQDKMVKQCYEELNKKIELEGLLKEEDKILIVDGTEALKNSSSTFSGLIANKFSKVNRPVLILNEKDKDGSSIHNVFRADITLLLSSGLLSGKSFTR